MCARITLLTYDEIVEVLDAVERRARVRLGRVSGRLQARPGSSLHALVPSCGTVAGTAGATDAAYAPGTAGTPGTLEIAPFTWGFTFPNDKKLVFNTRIESALGGTRMWKEPMRDGRCVLPVASFFEPHHAETVPHPRTGRSAKRQYEFASPDNEPLLLASVRQDGRLSVVTTEPNESVSPIHPRMPLALRFEEVGTWLDGDYASLANVARPNLIAQPERRAEDTDDSSGPVQLSLF